MNLIRSFFVAFAMYSKLPMPRVDWNKQNMAYALAFFPLIGLALGAVLLGWRWLTLRLGFGQFMFAAGALLGPLLVTGGIHLDGFCDVTDALSSWQTKERRLEILKDSHIGAFALIGLSCYLLVYLACWTEIVPDIEACVFIGAGYVLCRILSGLSIIHLHCAKTSGLAATFADNADKREMTGALTAWLIILGGLLIWWRPVWAICGLMVAALCFIWYRWLAYSKFGGINGDLAGWFLQVLELSWLVLVMLLQKLCI